MGNTPPQGPPPGWWRASDGLWYPPHLHPEYRQPVERRPSQFRSGLGLGVGIGCGLLVVAFVLFFLLPALLVALGR